MDTERFFLKISAAFIRGSLGADFLGTLHQKKLEELSEKELRKLLELGLQAELNLAPFKKTMGLRRVRAILGILKNIQPRNLLDIGSGRGAALWPMLDTFPDLSILATDKLPHRIERIRTVRSGGLKQVDAEIQDVTALPYKDRSFGVVTMLEVLEHIPDTSAALKEALRVANDFVILSVPSKEDNNPEHIHLFTENSLREHLNGMQMKSVKFQYVPNHLIAVINVRPTNS